MFRFLRSQNESGRSWLTDRAGQGSTQDRALLIVTRLNRLVHSTRDLLNVIAALADRVRHARGRSPESQEAGGRPCRMIF